MVALIDTKDKARFQSSEVNLETHLSRSSCKVEIKEIAILKQLTILKPLAKNAFPTDRGPLLFREKGT